MGVPAEPDEVLTSAGAAAALLAEELPAGAKVLVVGAEALRAELRTVGLVPVTKLDESPVAVVQGYGPEIGWADLAEASLAVRAGARWMATNTDKTLPSPRGPLPGNGSLVAVLRTALDRDPDVVVGKPEPGLFTAAASISGANRALVVGDRLDTDIAGANAAGLPSLLVLSGVSTAEETVRAAPGERPDYIAADLRGLLSPAGALRVGPHPAWRIDIGPSLVTVHSAGSEPPDTLTVVRATANAVWNSSLAGQPFEIVAGDHNARKALERWSLLTSAEPPID
jgi:glycerol 3-phosphatase-2